MPRKQRIEGRKRGPGQPKKPAAQRAVTKSLRLYRRELDDLKACRDALSTPERKAKESEVWRNALALLRSSFAPRQRATRGAYGCKDCGAHPTYMLRSEIWEAIDAKPDDTLCMPCAAKRLGRPIRARDLAPDVPANAGIIAFAAQAGVP
jgi:hypothetical protein